MKRFYCTICKKIKRARQYPILIDFNTSVIPTSVVDRTGVCNSHSQSNSVKVQLAVSNAEGRRIKHLLANRGR